MANSIPFAQRTSGLEVIGESEKATNLKQINVAQINCKLDIWAWGDSGTKKRERKNIHFRSASAMGFYFHLEYFKATLSPMLHSGHDVPFLSVCLCWSYAFPFMGFCFSMHRRFFFSGLLALSYLGYNCAEVLNIHIFFFPVSVLARICWSQFIDALSNRVKMIISSLAD